MLVKAGGEDLLMLTAEGGWSCLSIAAYKGHVEMFKVRRVQIDRKHHHTVVCEQIKKKSVTESWPQLMYLIRKFGTIHKQNSHANMHIYVYA